MSIPLSQLLRQLHDNQLLSQAEVQAALSDLPAQRHDSAEALIQNLVADGKLTKFQATQVLNGKTRALLMGDYVILDRLGAGGMGQVLKARHRRMKRIVALKLLSPSAMQKPGAVERFQREVTAAARLDHPHIVTAYDAGEANGQHYLVMQFVDGRDLSQVVKEQGPLPLSQALDYVLQAARGLAYAHGEGIIHRDIKPSNLLIDKSGTVKILDMGLARFEDSASAPMAAGAGALTQEGHIMGTVEYMAPEQAVDTRSADQRSDIYSLGCTLYMLLTGEPVYRGDTLVQTILAHRDQPTPGLRAKRPDVPEGVDSLFQRMVAKRPGDRCGSAQEVIEILEQQIDGLVKSPDKRVGSSAASATRRSSAAGASASEVSAGRSRLPALAIAAAAVLVLVVAGLLVALNSGSPPEVAKETTPTGDVADVQASSAPAKPAQVAPEADTPAPPAPAKPESAPAPAVATSVKPAEAPRPAPAMPPSNPPANSPPSPVVEQPRPPADKPNIKKEPPVAETPVVIPSGGLDILKLIDLQRDAKTPNWRFEGSALVGAATGAQPERLGFAVVPPQEYDLRLQFVPQHPMHGEIVLGLEVGKSRMGLFLNRSAKRLELVRQLANTQPSDDSVAPDEIDLASKEIHTLVCRVRPNELQVFVDGERKIDWKGDPSTFSVDEFFPPGEASRIALYVAKGTTSTGSFRFPRCELWPAGTAPLTAPTSAEPEPPLAEGHVNVLKLIDTRTHAVQGVWKRENHALLTPPGANDRISIPFTPPSEYLLELVATRRKGTDSGLLLGLVVGGRQCVLAVGQKDKAQLGDLDTKKAVATRRSTSDTVEGLADGALHPIDEPTLIQCFVTPKRVTLLIDGKSTLDWRGDNRRLSLDPQLQVPDSRELFLGVRGGSLLISRMEVIPEGVLPKSSRHAVPEENELQEALAAVKDFFRDDFVKSTRKQDKLELARKLIDEAAQNDDPASCYAMLMEARNLGAEFLEMELIDEIGELLGEDFAVDEHDVVAEGWERSLQKPHPPALNKQLAETALERLELAVEEESFPAAQKMAEVALAAARKALNGALVKQAQDRGKSLADEADQFTAIVKARDALAANANDPAANLAIGRYLCFMRGDWPKGLVHLSKSDDQVFKQLGERSLTDPGTGSGRVALGDAWWEEAAKAKDKTQVELRSGAAYWYSMAIPNLSGLEKIKIEQRLNEVPAIAALATGKQEPAKPRAPARQPKNKLALSKPVDLLKLIDPRRDAVVGGWSFRETALAMDLEHPSFPRLQIPFAPPPEYVLTVELARLGNKKGAAGIGLVVGGKQCCLMLDLSAPGGSASGLELIDGKDAHDNETTVRGAQSKRLGNTPSIIICSVRKTGIVITVDDAKIIDWKGDSRRLSLEPSWQVPNPAALFVGGHKGGGAFEFSKIEIAPPTD